MARRALRKADLFPGASLRGTVFDACLKNNIPNSFGMLQHFGMPNRNRVLVSESVHLDVAGLADALQIEKSEVVARRYPPHGRGHRSFFGLHVMKGRIEDRVRRFSPAAIRDGSLYHPATHELRDLPFSTVGWDMLQTICPCEEKGVQQNWVTVNGSSRCHSCGGSLGKIEPVPVPDELRDSLGFLAGLVDPDPVEQDAALAMLPPAIRGVDRTLLHDIVMNIARAASAEAETSDFLIRVRALAQACDAVMSWPEGLNDISFCQLCPENVRSWILRHYTVLDSCSQTVDFPRPPSLATVGPSAAPRRTYAPSGSSGKVKSAFIGAMAAARLGGVDETALKQAWDEGRFTKHVWVFGSLRVRAFDPSEVVAVAPLLRIAGSRSRAASYLGLPLYGLEQLLESRLFAPAPPSEGMKQTVTHLAAARDLVDRLKLNRSELGDTIPFVEAMRHVSGRMKPWGAAIAAMLDGDIAFMIQNVDVDTPIAGRLRVSARAIPTLIDLTDPRVEMSIERADKWMQGDALECLNGNVSAPELLKGLVSSGTPKKRLYSVADVLERARMGVTTSDIARRFDYPIKNTAMLLDANRVNQIAPGLWSRERAERIVLSHIEKRGAENPTVKRTAGRLPPHTD